jgi:hypothetical protein
VHAPECGGQCGSRACVVFGKKVGRRSQHLRVRGRRAHVRHRVRTCAHARATERAHLPVRATEGVARLGTRAHTRLPEGQASRGACSWRRASSNATMSCFSVSMLTRSASVCTRPAAASSVAFASDASTEAFNASCFACSIYHSPRRGVVSPRIMLGPTPQLGPAAQASANATIKRNQKV